MKFRVLAIILFSLSSLKMNSQSIFKVVEANRSYFTETVNKLEQKKYYRIKLVHDTSGISYPINIPNGEFDIHKAIKELLLLEDDVRLCSFPITNYNPLRSQIYLGSCKDYSIQVEALFIINQLILKKPFIYSSYPILVNRATKKEFSIKGSAIKKAFQAYKDWYRKIIKTGIDRIDSEEMMPLYRSQVKWY